MRRRCSAPSLRQIRSRRASDWPQSRQRGNRRRRSGHTDPARRTRNEPALMPREWSGAAAASLLPHLLQRIRRASATIDWDLPKRLANAWRSRCLSRPHRLQCQKSSYHSGRLVKVTSSGFTAGAALLPAGPVGGEVAPRGAYPHSEGGIDRGLCSRSSCSHWRARNGGAGMHWSPMRSRRPWRHTAF